MRRESFSFQSDCLWTCYYYVCWFDFMWVTLIWLTSIWFSFSFWLWLSFGLELDVMWVTILLRKCSSCWSWCVEILFLTCDVFQRLLIYPASFMSLWPHILSDYHQLCCYNPHQLFYHSTYILILSCSHSKFIYHFIVQWLLGLVSPFGNAMKWH
jgi:hypothetical protein